MRKSKKRAQAIQIRTYGAEPLDVPSPWRVVNEKLICNFEFPDFDTAKKFVDEISILAEIHNHHPDIKFGWGYVLLELFSHDENKITSRDLSLAQLISEI
jgi:pterin-4a-carbinolamine dehydratase